VELAKKLKNFYDDLAATVLEATRDILKIGAKELLASAFGLTTEAERQRREQISDLQLQLQQINEERILAVGQLDRIRRKEGETNDEYLERLRRVEDINAREVQFHTFKTKELELLEKINELERERNNILLDRLKNFGERLLDTFLDKIAGDLITKLIPGNIFGGKTLGAEAAARHRLMAAPTIEPPIIPPVQIPEIEMPELPQLQVESIPTVQFGELPNLPELSIATLPQLQVAELPLLQIGELPQLEVENMPTIHFDVLPELTVAELPQLQIGKLPMLQVGEVPQLEVKMPRAMPFIAPILTRERQTPVTIPIAAPRSEQHIEVNINGDIYGEKDFRKKVDQAVKETFVLRNR
jgi:hypothetical protein